MSRHEDHTTAGIRPLVDAQMGNLYRAIRSELGDPPPEAGITRIDWNSIEAVRHRAATEAAQIMARRPRVVVLKGIPSRINGDIQTGEPE